MAMGIPSISDCKVWCPLLMSPRVCMSYKSGALQTKVIYGFVINLTRWESRFPHISVSTVCACCPKRPVFELCLRINQSNGKNNSRCHSMLHLGPAHAPYIQGFRLSKEPQRSSKQRGNKSYDHSGRYHNDAMTKAAKHTGCARKKILPRSNSWENVAARADGSGVARNESGCLRISSGPPIKRRPARLAVPCRRSRQLVQCT